MKNDERIEAALKIFKPYDEVNMPNFCKYDGFAIINTTAFHIMLTNNDADEWKNRALNAEAKLRMIKALF